MILPLKLKDFFRNPSLKTKRSSDQSLKTKRPKMSLSLKTKRPEWAFPLKLKGPIGPFP